MFLGNFIISEKLSGRPTMYYTVSISSWTKVISSSTYQEHAENSLSTWPFEYHMLITKN